MTAHAHNAICSCFDTGDDSITCEGSFSDSEFAAGVPLKVFDQSGKVLLEGALDKSGQFRYARSKVPFRVELNAGEGHVVEIDGRDIENGFRLPRHGGKMLAAVLAALGYPAAHAHFQLFCTPQAALREAAPILLALVFSHPFDNGFTMDMGRPEEFYGVRQRGDGEPRTTGLTQYLEPIQWSGLES